MKVVASGVERPPQHRGQHGLCRGTCQGLALKHPHSAAAWLACYTLLTFRSLHPLGSTSSGLFGKSSCPGVLCLTAPSQWALDSMYTVCPAHLRFLKQPLFPPAQFWGAYFSSKMASAVLLLSSSSSQCGCAADSCLTLRYKTE